MLEGPIAHCEAEQPECKVPMPPQASRQPGRTRSRRPLGSLCGHPTFQGREGANWATLDEGCCGAEPLVATSEGRLLLWPAAGLSVMCCCCAVFARTNMPLSSPDPSDMIPEHAGHRVLWLAPRVGAFPPCSCPPRKRLISLAGSGPLAGARRWLCKASVAHGWRPQGKQSASWSKP